MPQISAICTERVLPFEKTENFRQLGGYRTKDGRQVRFGLLYRSGALADAVHTPHDKALLQSLGLRVVCDFRSASERSYKPDPELPGVIRQDIAAIRDSGGRDVNFDIASFFTMTADQLAQVLHQVQSSYASLPFDNPAYQGMFAYLLNGKAPLLFHCTAGKDRTGVAAALLLLALGVPRKGVVEDYLLTNPCRAATRAALREKFSAHFDTADPRRERIVEVFTGVSAENLQLALDAIDRAYPTFEAYLQDQYNINAAALCRLRQMYLE